MNDKHNTIELLCGIGSKRISEKEFCEKDISTAKGAAIYYPYDQIFVIARYSINKIGEARRDISNHKSTYFFERNALGEPYCNMIEYALEYCGISVDGETVSQSDFEFAEHIIY